MITIFELIGSNIQSCLKEKNISIEACAKLLDISEAGVSNILLGKRIVNENEIKFISKKLGVSMNSIISEESIDLFLESRKELEINKSQ